MSLHYVRLIGVRFCERIRAQFAICAEKSREEERKRLANGICMHVNLHVKYRKILMPVAGLIKKFNL